MSPQHRRAERTLLAVAAGWTALLSVLTLFPYQLWFSSTGFQALEDAEEIAAAGLVSEVAAVIRIYGVGLLLAALVSALIAWRMTVVHQRGVVWWLAVAAMGAFVTRDIIGALLFTVCLVLYLSRSRALRLTAVSRVPAGGTKEDR